MKRFDLQETAIEGLWILQRKKLGDSRGFLERMFCIEELEVLLGSRQIKQINRTFTQKKGTVRGLHFQRKPYEEMKFVSCLRGEVLDVAVDVRKDSATYLHWHGEVLSAENQKTFVISEGFAHGFQTLTDDCEMLYFHTEMYYAEFESGLYALDPVLKIEWVLPVDGLSQRDAFFERLTNNLRKSSD